ncbi:hypothetical protein GGI15_004008 [Coemansia interrupta]|uniref:Uncharacterized protein n=1 Tax=Coemansia interrupta TaxID=1126814 RepID=A0A9W8HB98_9FUNG|nr:hypothetical protein GGI15_004008 [Coemansia interrupta]
MSTPDVTAATTTPAPASTASGDHIHAPSTAATASDAFHASLPQHFPSNDVDSYWYNQPDAEDNDTTRSIEHNSVYIDTSRRSATLRRLGRLPLISRSPASEESRRAMLDVIRMHRTFASGNNSDDSDDDTFRHSPHSRQHQSTQQPYAPMRMQHPSWLAAAMDNHPPHSPGSGGSWVDKSDSSETASVDSQLMKRLKARAEEQLLRWLTKHTVAAQALDCSLLRPGIEFRGVQRITETPDEPLSMRSRLLRQTLSIEKWDVHVVIQSVDMKRGRVSGLMKAINVPRMFKTVVTHWDGEIIDFVNYTPLTDKWNAKSMRGKRMPQILQEYIFMRWKENAFVNVQPNETGLTIEGFYYICMNRVTGAIEGAYFDPSTQPNQRLALTVENNGRSLTFSSAEIC